KGIFNLKWVEGSDQVIAELGDHGAFVDKGFAKSHHLSIGSPLSLTSSNGKTLPLEVRGIFNPPPGRSPFGPVTISDAAWDRITPQPQNLYSFVQMKGGENDANRAALEQQLASFPNAKVQTKHEFIDNQIGPLNAIL